MRGLNLKTNKLFLTEAELKRYIKLTPTLKIYINNLSIVNTKGRPRKRKEKTLIDVYSLNRKFTTI